MMTANDIIDTADPRNILSVFGIFYLIVFCLLPFFVLGIVKGITNNITLFVIGILLIVGFGEGEESPAFFPCWNLRVFNQYGQSVEERGLWMNFEGEIGIEPNSVYEQDPLKYTRPERMYAMNDKNSEHYICSSRIFNPSSLWMCPGIVAIPVLFCLVVVGSLIKGLFSEEK